MSFLFGKRETPEEMLRKNQRALNKAMRDLDRERMHLESQEKKVIVDIKKMAKMGQMVRVWSIWIFMSFALHLRPGTDSNCNFKDAVKVMAKDLVRTRQASKKFMLMKANIQAVSLKITTLKSNHAMAQAMKGVTKAMATMNKKVPIHSFMIFQFCWSSPVPICIQAYLNF
jgi:charged multivesicular body protein 2A